MNTIILIIALAVIVEALVQYAKNIYDGITGGDKKTAITQLSAIGVAVIICFSTGADLFSPLGIVFKWPGVGVLLTGIIISRGSNYAADFVKKLQSPKIENLVELTGQTDNTTD